MSWREQVDLGPGLVWLLAGDGRMILVAGILLSVAMALWLVLRTQRKKALGAPGETGDDASEADSGLAPLPEDRIVPLGSRGFLLLVVALAAGVWITGYVLAGPDRKAFLAAREWQFQPFYIAAHLVTLRLFVSVFTRNFRHGIARLDAPMDELLAGMHRVLGLPGALSAALVALPFCLSDWLYLNGPRYERLTASAPLQAIDYMMWAIWCAEWLINAFIWMILVGFLYKNVRTLRRFRFRSPIELVLQEKHYRPFLRMSSQGATVVLGFWLMSVLYISYTGGAVTDYMGLIITGLLLVIGFVVPWVLLRRKVSRSIAEEQVRLQAGLAHRAEVGTTAGTTGAAPALAPSLQSLAERLDYVATLLRLTHLDRLRGSIGRAEARAVAIRLLAPAATVAWQLSQSYKPLLDQLNRSLQTLLARLSVLIG
jgi:hypothetical protein